MVATASRLSALAQRKHILWPALAGLLVSVPLVAGAASDDDSGFDWLLLEVPSSVSLDYGWDADGGRDLSAQADLPLGDSARLHLGAGSADDGDAATDDSSHWSLGLFSDPLAEQVFGLRVEDRGASGEFTVRSYSASWRHGADSWAFGIEPGLREIEIHGQRRNGTPVSASVDGESLALSAAWYPADLPAWRLNWTRYRYQRDPAGLDPELRPTLLLFFSPTALNQSQGLDDWRAVAGVALDTPLLPLDLEYSRWRSAVDGDLDSSLLLSTRLLLDEHLSLRFGLGRQYPEDGAALSFASAGVDFSW